MLDSWFIGTIIANERQEIMIIQIRKAWERNDEILARTLEDELRLKVFPIIERYKEGLTTTEELMILLARIVIND